MFLIEIFIDRNTYRLDQTFTYRVNEKDYETLVFGSAVFVTFNRKSVVGYVVKKFVNEESKYKIRYIESIVKVEVLNELQCEMYQYLLDNFVCSFSNAYRLVLPSFVRSNIAQKLEVKVREVIGYRVDKDTKLTVKQKVCFDIINKYPDISRLDLVNKFNQSVNVINKLVEINAIKKINVAYNYQYQFGLDQDLKHKLNNEQVECIKAFKNDTRDMLLHGVTGSGKTHIYIELIKEYINNKQQVLLLVPEISLTQTMTSKLESIFGDELVFIHSKLNKREYYDYYLKIKNNEVKVIIGTRSGIFMPFDNLGLIIIDEEHDSSYKHNVEPFYHVKDMFKFWQQQMNCRILYGSATPSLESYVRVEKQTFGLIELKNRYFDVFMPSIIIDKLDDYEQILTYKSLIKIKEQLAMDKKVVILYNKKGYARSVECNVCNHIASCPECNVPLIYYKKTNKLQCNLCGYHRILERNCSSCKSSDSYKLNGIGIEKVASYLETMFGANDILMIDSDVVSKKRKFTEIMTAFKTKGKKILIGTQIISKGLDIADVDLVVIINVDNALYFNDIKANEKVFDLLLQTAGRAGRHSNNGEVIIQTKHPDHKIFKYVREYDYQGFYKDEIEKRRVSRYGPFYLVAKIEVRHKIAQIANNYLDNLKLELTKDNLYTTQINKPYISYIDNKHSRIMLVKYKDKSLVEKLNYFKNQSLKKGVEVIIDLNIN
jgi:primosomal protein N' (replication factor Y)